MSGDNVIPGSLCDGPPHVYEVFDPPFIGHNYYYEYEAGLGVPGTLKPGTFAIPNQPALAQVTAGGYGYSGYQGIVWDFAAQPSQYGELAQLPNQPPTEAYLGNLATIDHGLQPETPASSEISPGHHADFARERSQEKNRQAAAKYRKRIKQQNKDLLDKEAEFRTKNESLWATREALEQERMLLIQELFQHSNCGDENIQRYLQLRASHIAVLRKRPMMTTINGSP
ncbi:hypothetical protein PG985_004831 [Apiospora marii]|uniref:uncharacterized protein n=1 Tax=Apiospora marii TaxID=335849 RepID=UPI003131FD09